MNDGKCSEQKKQNKTEKTNEWWWAEIEQETMQSTGVNMRTENYTIHLHNTRSRHLLYSEIFLDIFIFCWIDIPFVWKHTIHTYMHALGHAYTTLAPNTLAMPPERQTVLCGSVQCARRVVHRCDYSNCNDSLAAVIARCSSDHFLLFRCFFDLPLRFGRTFHSLINARILPQIHDILFMCSVLVHSFHQNRLIIYCFIVIIFVSSVRPLRLLFLLLRSGWRKLFVLLLSIEFHINLFGWFFCACAIRWFWCASAPGRPLGPLKQMPKFD